LLASIADGRASRHQTNTRHRDGCEQISGADIEATAITSRIASGIRRDNGRRLTDDGI
jgi:hypothetical protein